MDFIQVAEIPDDSPVYEGSLKTYDDNTPIILIHNIVVIKDGVDLSLYL